MATIRESIAAAAENMQTAYALAMEGKGSAACLTPGGIYWCCCRRRHPDTHTRPFTETESGAVFPHCAETIESNQCRKYREKKRGIAIDPLTTACLEASSARCTSEIRLPRRPACVRNPMVDGHCAFKILGWLHR
jgi:hypothetical protein